MATSIIHSRFLWRIPVSSHISSKSSENEYQEALKLLTHRDKLQKEWLTVVKKACTELIEACSEDYRIPVDQAVDVSFVIFFCTEIALSIPIVDS
jgi:hypothetical protein